MLLVRGVLHDPLGVFTLSVAGSDVTVDASVGPTYLASPYPCQVRLVTNRGVWTIDLGIAKDRTAADDAELGDSLHQRQRLCAQIALTTIPFDELFAVPTGPVPPKEAFGVDRWLLARRLEVGGLAPESRVVLRQPPAAGRHAEGSQTDRGWRGRRDGLGPLRPSAACRGSGGACGARLDARRRDRSAARARRGGGHGRRRELACELRPRGQVDPDIRGCAGRSARARTHLILSRAKLINAQSSPKTG